MPLTWFLRVFVFLVSANCVSAFGQSIQPVSALNFIKSGKAYHLDIPFRIIHGLPAVELTIKGHEPSLFLVDTGFTNTVIDRSLGSQLGFRVTADRGPDVIGTDESGPHSSYKTKKLKLYSQRDEILRGTIAAVDLSWLRSKIPGVVGVLGYDVLGKHPIVVDYTKHLLTIISDDSFQDDVHLGWMPLNSSKRSPIVEANISVGATTLRKVKILIDTGSDLNLQLGGRLSKEYALIDYPSLKHSIAGSIEGTFPYDHGLRGSIDFAPATIILDDISFSRASSGRTLSDEFDALLGNAVLSRYLLVLDGSRNRILFLSVEKN